MQKAWERKRKFDAKGKCVEDEQSVGAIVPWSLVSIIALFAGKWVSIPTSFWNLFKH